MGARQRKAASRNEPLETADSLNQVELAGFEQKERMVTEYRYLVVLADGFAYDPDRPIDKETKRILRTDWDDKSRTVELAATEAEKRQLQESIERAKRNQAALREQVVVQPNRLLAEGWIPIRETPFGYGCLLVLSRTVETSGKHEVDEHEMPSTQDN